MKKLKTALALFCCIIMTISGLKAQELKGRVLSNQGEAVPFANVYWLHTTEGTTTDADGYFQLHLHANHLTLIVSSVGYTSDTIEVKLDQKQLEVRLKNAVDLKEVDVVYRKKGTEISFMDNKKVEQIGEKELRKAACCNLSESFETVPSIDVTFTDALTGTKKIRMLGLEGPYTFISRENMPGVRGLGSAYGLNFIPGTWIKSIQLSKGVGSVRNGYESIAGQINIELKKPDMDEVFVNLYTNQSGRSELNYNQNFKVGKNWSTLLLLHTSMRPFEVDQNKDGFMDFPTGNQINIMNRWQYYGDDGISGQINFQYLKDNRIGGQMNYTDKQSQLEQNRYGLKINTERLQAFGKIGYVFADKPYKSMGFQTSVLRHNQQSYFGLNTYNAQEQFFYANYLYHSQIGNDKHSFTTGASYIYDDYDEKAYDSTYKRTEKIPGLFFEYTFAPSNNLSFVGGIRADFNNIYGNYFTPRFHSRWAMNEKTVVRMVAGGGQRTANIFAENQAMFATSRIFQLMGDKSGLPFGLQQEKAYNFGINLTRDFKLNYRNGSFGIDLYHTVFNHQVVYDIEDVRDVRIYNLDGKSYSNSVQAEINYELFKFFDVKLAYRFLDVKTQYLDGFKQKPLSAKHRIFSNFAYETRKNPGGGNWKFDLTIQYLGKQRIPSTADNIEANQRALESNGFLTANTQITRTFNKKWDTYLGIENLTNFQQNQPIISSNNPFGGEFDSSLIWGPIFGRMVYAGVRFTISDK